MKVRIEKTNVPMTMRPILGAAILERTKSVSFGKDDDGKVSYMVFEVPEFRDVLAMFWEAFARLSRMSEPVAMALKYNVRLLSASGREIEVFVKLSEDYKGIHYGYIRELRPGNC